MALRCLDEEQCRIPDDSLELKGRGPPTSAVGRLPLALRPCKLEPWEASGCREEPLLPLPGEARHLSGGETEEIWRKSLFWGKQLHSEAQHWGLEANQLGSHRS